MNFRDPSKEELRLLQKLILLSESDLMTQLNGLRVKSMDDGGMGSLDLKPEGIVESQRIFGTATSELEFLDEDGVIVLATLYLDKDGNLFELDSWKMDYSPLLKYPD